MRRGGSVIIEIKNKTSTKFVIAGGFGVGKTTFIGAISEIEPLRTEAAITSAAIDGGMNLDAISYLTEKTTTTVAMDFGRISVDDDLLLYLFGTPCHERFGFMWDDLTAGSLGAVVLVDSRRLADSFYSIAYFESKGIPFSVAVNLFDGTPHHHIDDIRAALQLDDEVVLLECDVRDRESVKTVLLSLFETIGARVSNPAPEALAS